MTSVSVDTVAPIKSFLWDEENRLLAVNNNGSVSCYFYDAAGERTVKLTSGGKSKIADALWDSGKKGMGNNKLRDALGLVKGDKRQAHRLIPRELIEKNIMVRDAIEEGFDFNGKINGIALGPSKHKGSHPNYTSFVEGLLEQVKGDKTLDTDRKKLEWVAGEVRKKIESCSGKIDSIE